MGEEAVLALPADAVRGAEACRRRCSVRTRRGERRTASSGIRRPACRGTSAGRRGGGSDGRTSRSQISSIGSRPDQCERRSSRAPRVPRRRRAVVREHPLPRLHRPVGPVRRRARGDTARRAAARGTRPQTLRADRAADGEREGDLRLATRLGARASTAPQASECARCPPSGTRPARGPARRPARRTSVALRPISSEPSGGAHGRSDGRGDGTRGSWLRDRAARRWHRPSPLARGRGRGPAGHSTGRESATTPGGRG